MSFKSLKEKARSTAEKRVEYARRVASELKPCQEYLAQLKLEITQFQSYKLADFLYLCSVAWEQEQRRANHWDDTHGGSRRVSGTGNQKGEQILSAGECWNDIVMMECRLERDNG